ncbi:MAG: hypothetical protein ABUT20_63940, partial [Bacteroidota bacterium]
MKKNLLVAFSTCVGIIFSINVKAQIKGDPVFNVSPQQLRVQKTDSKLSPELQKLYDNSTGTRNVQPP